MSKPSDRRPLHEGDGDALVSDLGRLSVAHLVTVFCGLLVDPDVGEFSATRFAVRAPLAVLGALGISPNAVRMALSRQVRRGILVSEKYDGILTYSITEEGRQMIERAGARISAEDPFASTFTVWTLASFSVPESRRELRNRLRIHLSRCGFRPLRDGLWVALNNFAAELATRDLDPEIAGNCDLDVFLAKPYAGTDLSDLFRSGWDVDDMRVRHERFFARWADSELTGHPPLPLLTLFSADWIDLLQHDPGLPPEVVGAQWPARRSAAVASRVFRVLRAPAGIALGELLVSTGSQSDI